ncbi:MAG TPA: enoyl-CoA hydratase/isomerase family protein [Ruminococcus sp.]|nr:enoyl-CoA hydratase/isomerase family protein [Ruminococcus sp.]
MCDEREFFTLEKNDGILMLAMNAPNNNLMTDDFFSGYEYIMSEVASAAEESSIKGMVIRSGGRHFSVGADVNALSERSSAELTKMENENDIPKEHFKQKNCFTFLNELPFPVVSAVNGFCIGSGSEIAVNSHYRICEKNSRIGQPESTFGILPALGGIARTIEVCGLQNAFRMIFSGELLSAEESYQIGWADEITEKKKSVGRALELIQFINRYDKHFNKNKTHEYLEHFQAAGGACAV